MYACKIQFIIVSYMCLLCLYGMFRCLCVCVCVCMCVYIYIYVCAYIYSVYYVCICEFTVIQSFNKHAQPCHRLTHSSRTTCNIKTFLSQLVTQLVTTLYTYTVRYPMICTLYSIQLYSMLVSSECQSCVAMCSFACMCTLLYLRPTGEEEC